MNRLIFSVLLSLFGYVAVSQTLIQSDTTIYKTLSVNGSFELSFSDWPGTGGIWHLIDPVDSTKISIYLLKNEVQDGYGVLGGKYVTTYKYACLARGSYVLNYIFDGPTLQGSFKKCSIYVEIE